MNRGRGLLVGGLLGLAACIDTTGSSAIVPDLIGSWRYVGVQGAPTVQLTGLLVIEAQEGDLIAGRANWEARTPTGMVTQAGGSVGGRVIGDANVDFEVLLAPHPRRHVARIVGDTMRGSWVEVGTGAAGEFTAIRGGS